MSHLQDIDQDNHYVVLVPTKDLKYWKPSNPNFSLMACDYKNYSFGEQVGLLRQLQSLKPDLVHFCMPQQPILYRGKTVTTIHDLTLLRTNPSAKNPVIFRIKQWVGHFVFHRVIKKSTIILTDSEFSKQDIIQFDGAAKNKTLVTHLGAGSASDEQKAYQLPFSNYLLYVGQQLDHKNIPHLAEAHQLLLTKYPDLGLVLAGRLTPEANAHQQLFQDKGYKNIYFTDFISDPELNWLYANCRVYVFPSLMEGFGLPGLEAMMHGAPVASSNTTCLPEILGDAAMYFDPRNTQDISETISQYLDSDELRFEKIALGKNQIKKYSWSRMAEQTAAAYDKILEAS